MNIYAFIRRLLCGHTKTTFVRNIWGDEVLYGGGKRSAWRCDSCGDIVYRNELHHG